MICLDGCGDDGSMSGYQAVLSFNGLFTSDRFPEGYLMTGLPK
jgi:hypothetical protein